MQLQLHGGFILSVVLFADHNEQRKERQKDHDHLIIRHDIAPFRFCTRLRERAHRQRLPAYVHHHITSHLSLQ